MTVPTNGYADTTDLKARVGATGTSLDSLFDQVILAASRQIDAMTNDSFVAVTAGTKYLTATWSDYLELPPGGLRTVTSLKTDEDGDRVYEVTWATTDYDLEPFDAANQIPPRPYRTIRLTPDGLNEFPTIRRSVEIVGNWGWATVPDAVEEACLILATRLYERKNAPFGIAGSSELGQATLLPRNDPDVRALLMGYTRLAVGVV